MNHRILLSSLILPGLIAALALRESAHETASGPDTSEPIRLRSSATLEGDIVALTALHSPTLAALGATKRATAPQALIDQSRLVGGDADLQDRLAGVYAVALDMQALGKRELTVFERTVLRGAEKLDVPIVIENPNAERMSELFGFGVDAPVVLQRGRDVYPLGGGQFAEVPIAPMSRSEIARRIDEILIDEPARRSRSGGPGSLPNYSYQVRYVHVDESSAYVAEYLPDSSLVPPPADFDIVFEIEWWYENNHKYCAINTRGAGFDPRYVHQSRTHQGYYQDQMFVQYGPAESSAQGSSIELLDFAPRDVEQQVSVGRTESSSRGFSGGIGASRSGPTGSLNFSSSSSTSTSTTYTEGELTHFRQAFGPDDDSVQFFAGMNKSYYGGRAEFTNYTRWEDLLRGGLGYSRPILGSPGQFLVWGEPILNVPVSVSIDDYNIYSAACWIANGARADSSRFSLAAGQRLIDINVFPHPSLFSHVLMNGATMAASTDVWIDWGSVSGDAATTYVGVYGLAVAPAERPQFILDISQVSGAQLRGDLWIAGQPFPVTGTHVAEPFSDHGHALIKVYADPGHTFPLATFYLKPQLVHVPGTLTATFGYESYIGIHVGFDPGYTKEDLFFVGLELNATNLRLP